MSPLIQPGTWASMLAVAVMVISAFVGDRWGMKRKSNEDGAQLFVMGAYGLRLVVCLAFGVLVIWILMSPAPWQIMAGLAESSHRIFGW